MIAPSQDRVGRPCPLVVFQEVTHREMKRIWSIEVDEPIKWRGRHMLFWWAQFAASAKGATDLSMLIADMEMVWRSHEPTFLEMLSGTLGKIDISNLEDALAKWQSASKSDVIMRPKGVSRLPWTDWPSRLFQKREAIPAYWIQDVLGGYVCASDDVLKLWEVTE